ncbi:MAG TPA: hypothetical protein VFE18_19340 [Phenylobacterium sp.]|uniref:hypothetical protein n=1 Tax=Phenylobacterium sp. TaxID=1871053 RepID=UPI002D278B28|nr:hypothetical protein [Phenylobacterium sp.]HZZ70330.1 hypothetical protein [Phenylobacterium sp.]
MKFRVKCALVAAAAAGAFGLAATSASAAVVCNAENECWHVKGHYDYKPEWNLSVHPDNWRWGAADHYKWHEHRGRGYWSNGVWIKF